MNTLPPKTGITVDEILPLLPAMDGNQIDRLIEGMKLAIGELSLPGYESDLALWFLTGGGIERFLSADVRHRVYRFREGFPR